MVKKIEKNPEITPEEVGVVEEIVEDKKDDAVKVKETVKKTTAKAGKRSAKAEKEAEAEVEKEARKAEVATTEEAPKPKQKPRVKKYSKKQKAMREAIELDKLYTAEEAIGLVKKINQAKFDSTLEVHLRLGIDPRQADQMLRASTVLPAGTGKSVRVAVLTGDEKKAAAAKAAGAELTNSEDLLAAISKGSFEFDVLVATPDMMPQLGRHAKALGPKGLMPSPKSGTVSADPAAAVSEIKKGRLEIKNDANGIVHTAVGKLSFKDEDLLANLKAVLNCVQANRPSGVKGTYVKSIFVSATMTPGVKLDTAELAKK